MDASMKRMRSGRARTGACDDCGAAKRSRRGGDPPQEPARGHYMSDHRGNHGMTRVKQAYERSKRWTTDAR